MVKRPDALSMSDFLESVEKVVALLGSGRRGAQVVWYMELDGLDEGFSADGVHGLLRVLSRCSCCPGVEIYTRRASSSVDFRKAIEQLAKEVGGVLMD